VDPGFFRPRRHDGNGIAPSARNNKVSRIDGHTARDKLCKLHTAVLAQVPVVEVKSVNDLLLATAGKELLAVGSEAKSIESLLHLGPVDNGLSFEIEGDDFMLPEAGVKNGKPTATGMKGDVHRENSKLHLPAGRPK
jgi:hypothetical protein